MDFSRKNTIISASCTVFIWAILVVFAFLVPVIQKAPEYRTISITLPPLPKIEEPPVEKPEKEIKDEILEETPEIEQITEVEPVQEIAPVITSPVQEPLEKEAPAEVREVPKVVDKVVAAAPAEKPTEPAKRAETSKKAEAPKTESKQEIIKPSPIPQTPTTQAPAPVVKQAETPAPVEKATSTPAKQQIVKSMEELMAENEAKRAVKKQSAEWDESIFDNAAVNTTTSTAPVVMAPKTDSSALVGVAASSSNTDNGSAVSSSTDKTDKVGTVQSATAATTDALSRIAQAATTFSGKGTGDGISYETTIGVSGNGAGGNGVSVSLTDGSARALLEPSTPEIVISAANEKLIESTTTVTISFTILENGSVPAGSIEILPAGLIPVQIQTEIKAQVSRWRFEISKSNGQARFKYSINKM